MGDKIVNVFDIPDPETWSCEAVDFNNGASLEARKPGMPYYYKIYFLSCSYLRLPMKWSGANFCLASSDDCREFVQRQNQSGGEGLYGYLWYVELNGVKLYVQAHRTELVRRDL